MCSQPASFGVGVRLHRGEQGRWYCFGHYLMTEDGQEMAARNMEGAMQDVDFNE